MTPREQQFLAFVKQVLERAQPKKAICDECGKVVLETDYHVCDLDERAKAAARRAWIALTGDPMKQRAKGYAVR